MYIEFVSSACGFVCLKVTSVFNYYFYITVDEISQKAKKSFPNQMKSPALIMPQNTWTLDPSGKFLVKDNF